MAVTSVKPLQPKWFTDMKGTGAQAGAKATLVMSIEDRVAAVEKTLDAHGLFSPDRK